MVAELRIWIQRAESSWLDDLYQHAMGQFRDCSLPSHDHTHHMRVWNLGKALLNELKSFNSGLDQALVEGVLVAAFFHDLGMATSTREDHGRLSRICCEQWFRETGRETPQRFQEILQAIELHDRKEEEIYDFFHPGTAPRILGILSVADDLEALGTIGIFRYAEIYLRRGIPLEELGTRVLHNAQSRFVKFREGCRLCEGLLARYQEEYDELMHFFEEYNLQLANTEGPETENNGPLGVINYIRMHGLTHTELERTTHEVQDYFRKLDYELGKARL